MKEDTSMRMLIVIVCASLSGGCVSHRSIPLDPPTQAAMADVGLEAAGRSLWLHVDVPRAMRPSACAYNVIPSGG